MKIIFTGLLVGALSVLSQAQPRSGIYAGMGYSHRDMTAFNNAITQNSPYKFPGLSNGLPSLWLHIFNYPNNGGMGLALGLGSANVRFQNYETKLRNVIIGGELARYLSIKSMVSVGLVGSAALNVGNLSLNIYKFDLGGAKSADNYKTTEVSSRYTSLFSGLGLRAAVSPTQDYSITLEVGMRLHSYINKPFSKSQNYFFNFSELGDYYLNSYTKILITIYQW
ncbi:hypothetical protein GC194_15325 [bacterium]|nr:hypothetical protein [bacterium]